MFTDFVASDATNSSKDADDIIPSPKVWKGSFCVKTVVKVHLTFRVMNYGLHVLLKLNLYSWYTCTFVVLKNQCLIYYVLPIFDNGFFSLHQSVSIYILYTLTMRVLCFEHKLDYSVVHWISKKRFAHAQYIGWTLILMSNKSSNDAHWVTFAHWLN